LTGDPFERYAAEERRRADGQQRVDELAAIAEDRSRSLRERQSAGRRCEHLAFVMYDGADLDLVSATRDRDREMRRVAPASVRTSMIRRRSHPPRRPGGRRSRRAARAGPDGESEPDEAAAQVSGIPFARTGQDADLGPAARTVGIADVDHADARAQLHTDIEAHMKRHGVDYMGALKAITGAGDVLNRHDPGQ
jgi:hypothetical protein